MTLFSNIFCNIFIYSIDLHVYNQSLLSLSHMGAHCPLGLLTLCQAAPYVDAPRVSCHTPPRGSL